MAVHPLQQLYLPLRDLIACTSKTVGPAQLSATVLSSFIAANATFDLNTGAYFRWGLLGMIEFNPLSLAA